MKDNNKMYTSKYFKEGMPEWKRIKDPITTRIFYRPISFFIASCAAKMGITANMVSYFSIIVAILSCVCIAWPNNIVNIVGAILVNVWLILDCTDGNLARSVKKQAFGDFADSISSYVLVALLGFSLGLSAFYNGGVFFEKNSILIIILGFIASISDTLMRLIYQKFKSAERNLADKGLIEIENDKRIDNTQTNSLLVRIESDFGVGGFLPIMILIGILLKLNDLLVIYCFVYYFSSCVVMSAKYILKAIKKAKIIERIEE